MYNFTMKKTVNLSVAAVLLFLFSCAPVIKKDLMETGVRDVSLTTLVKNPSAYKGRLFILGGIIAQTKVTGEGTLIEAVYVPVDSRGYLRDIESQEGRFMILYPKEQGVLDPMIYRMRRELTVAGEFIGTRTGKLDEAEYIFPLFLARQVYLWREEEYYYPYDYPYSPYPYRWDRPGGRSYPYWWDDPTWRPYYPEWP